MLGGEIWAVGGGPNLETIYDANLYYPAEPCIHYGLALAPESLALSGNPGETIDYLLTLTNTGNATDYFSLTASGLWQSPCRRQSTMGAGERSDYRVVTIPRCRCGDATARSPPRHQQSPRQTAAP
jgi:hypothetical protein